MTAGGPGPAAGLRLLVVGLDGATWTAIEPLVAAGELPHLARVMAGVRGPLESTLPPVTPPAWTSFMTGKNPGRHGLYHFVEPEPGTYRMRYTNARSRKARTIWRLLSEAGHRVGVVNVPMTFPPEPVEGFMISGMDTPDDTSEFVHPRGLADEIRRSVGRIRLDVRYLGFMSTDARRRLVLRELEEVDEQRLRLVLHLLDRHPVEVLMVVYGSPDTVQHYFWHFADRTHHRHDPRGAAAFGGAIADVYRRLDRHLGALVERLAGDGTVLVVSDHGFGPTSSRVIHLNRYLAQLGVLAYRRDGRAGLTRAAARAVRGLDRLVRGNLSSEQKRRLATLFPGLRVRWESSLTAVDAIDWTATRAYASEVLASPGSIWINLRGRQPQGVVEPGAEYEELVEFLVERLQALKDPESGASLVQRVLRKEDAYAGPYLHLAPDLLLAWWEGDGFSTRRSDPGGLDAAPVTAAPAAGGDPSEWSGTHRLHGILAARGPGLRRGARVAGARIMDLAPTVLFLMGEPIPDDMDGRVLTELFDARAPDARPVRYRPAAADVEGDGAGTYSSEEAETVRRRLQELGYVE